MSCVRRKKSPCKNIYASIYQSDQGRVDRCNSGNHTAYSSSTSKRAAEFAYFASPIYPSTTVLSTLRARARPRIRIESPKRGCSTARLETSGEIINSSCELWVYVGDRPLLLVVLLHYDESCTALYRKLLGPNNPSAVSRFKSLCDQQQFQAAQQHQAAVYTTVAQ